MKMSATNYGKILDSFRDLSSREPSATPAKYRELGLTAERFAWDAFYAAKIEGDSGKWLCGTLYPAGLNDSHVETAIKRAAREVYGA